MEARLPLSAMPISAEGDGVIVRVTMPETKSCEMGSADLLEFDQIGRTRGKILLTIEALEPAPTSLAPVVYDVTKLSREGSVDLLIPPDLLRYRQLGIFLCTHSARGVPLRCFGKPFRELQDRKHFFQTTKLPERYRKDAIYGFQYLLVRDQQVSFFDPKRAVGSHDDLRSYLSAIYRSKTLGRKLTEQIVLGESLGEMKLSPSAPDRSEFRLTRFHPLACDKVIEAALK